MLRPRLPILKSSEQNQSTSRQTWAFHDTLTIQSHLHGRAVYGCQNVVSVQC